MIECRYAPQEPDPELKEKLRREGGRILQWALEAPTEQPRVPAVVESMGQRYREDSDPLADWLAACVTLDEDAFEPVRELRTSYVDWCKDEDQEPIRNNTFSALLNERFGDRRFAPRIDGRVTKCRLGMRLNAMV